MTTAFPAVLLVAGCTAKNSAQSAPVRIAETTPTAVSPKAKPKVRAPVVKVKVPNVVGMNHQAAQDLLQSEGFYLLAERDATGQGRILLWDRDWVVVRRSPAGG